MPESAHAMPERRFVYRPAPVGSRLTVVVGPDSVAVEGSWSLDLTDIRSMAFFQGRVGESQMVRLDLQGSNTTRSISINTGRTGSRSSTDELQFYAALIATLRAVVSVRPEMRVVLGETGKAQRILFGLGVVAVALGAGLLTAAVVTGVPAGKLAAAAVPFSLLILFGSALVRSHWPWRKRAHVSPEELIATLNKAMPELQAEGKRE